MSRLIIFFTFFILILFSCTRGTNPKATAFSYCRCLNDLSSLGRDSALAKCRESVLMKCRLLRIYYNTRDTFITDIYDESTIKEVNAFVAEFSREMDSCSSIYWYK
jgi:hypothetical protein